MSKLKSIILLSTTSGALILGASLWATNQSGSASEANRALLQIDDRLPEDRGFGAGEVPSTPEPTHVLAGDGQLYENRPRPVYQPVDQVAAAEDWRPQVIAEQPHREQARAMALCPDAVPLQYEGASVCAERCRRDADCPDGQTCRYDIDSGSDMGVCLP